MWLSLSGQATYFLLSLVLGLAFGAAYDVLRALRVFTKAKGARSAADALFFVLCGVLTSLFALPLNKGGVRGFILFGEAVGFLTYRFTLGSIMGKFYSLVSVFLRNILQKVSEFLEKIFNLLLKAGAFMLYNIGVLIDRFRAMAKRITDTKRKSRRTRVGNRRKHKDRSNEQKRNSKAENKGKYQDREP